VPQAEDVERSSALPRLAKARQFLRGARTAHDISDLDAAVSDAILAGIAATDAVLAWRFQVRSASTRHAQAVVLLRAEGGSSVTRQVAALERLLRLKSSVQYGDRLCTAREATEALARAERLVAWAVDEVEGRS
jgi:hypothetical protein